MKFFNLFKVTSISTKFTIINSLVMTITLVIMSILFLVIDEINSEKKLKEDLILQSNLISYHIQTALIFNDKNAATETLQSFKSIKSVTFSAVLDDLNEEIFAYYQKGSSEKSKFKVDEFLWGFLSKFDKKEDMILFDDRTYYVKHRIIISENEFGWIYVVGTMDEYFSYRGYIAFIILSVFFVSLILSFLVVLRVQKVLSKPLLSLSHQMKRVIDHGDYSVKVEKSSEDEIGTLTDAFNEMMTAIIEREKSLKQHQERLEIEVSKRTRQLIKTNSELEATVLSLSHAKNRASISEENKKIAEESLKAKSQFFANMSHELRTPLNGVLGMLGLMCDTSLTNEQKNFANVAIESGKTLLNILNDILDLSKIESGKLELEEIEFNIGDAVNDALILLSESSYKKNVELILETKFLNDYIVLGDPTRFKQIVYNLVGNAIKFTSEGYIKLVLDVRSFAEQTLVVYCQVIDTGIGIKRESIEIIFNKFSQADSSTTRKYGGTGLGLSLCRELVSLMGGEINLQSEFGKGSVFSFNVTFKLKKEVVACQLDLSHQPLILVLDRSTESFNAINSLLNHSCSLLSCFSIDDFLGIIEDKKNKIDVAVIDIHMIESRLNDLLFIKSKLDSFDIKIVFMGAMLDKNKLIYFSENIDFFIEKPIKKSMLFSFLNKIFKKETHKNDFQAPSVVNKRVFNFESCSVLVVEDNKVNQKVIVGRLSKLGIHCVISENGLEAINCINHQDFDLIFMDCQMPVMDGYQATKEILRLYKIEKIKKTPIIAMTANAMKGDREKCLESGMDDYISKPFSQDELFNVLDKWLKK